jgi:hypothetical protein
MTSLLSCRLCGQAIKFDDKHVGHRTGKKIPLDIDTEEPHDCPVWRVASNTKHNSNHNDSNNHTTNNKHNNDIINVVRVAAKRYTSMQTTKRAKVENGFRLTRRQENRIDANNDQ